MKTNQRYPHPIDIYPQRIKEEGIVVFDNVRGLPTGGERCVLPDYVICIAHSGRLELMYEDVPDYIDKYAVGVIFPHHCIRKVSKTDDYLATLIVVDSSMLSDPMLQIINQMRYRYEPHPCVKLDRREYRMILNVVELMRETARLKLPDWRALMSRQLEFFLRLLSSYRASKLHEPGIDKRVSTQFHNDLIQHFRQHHDVGFYAEKACLSTKHFSSVVKQETGHNVAYLIHHYIVKEAKMLLHMRRDLPVQTIANMLGFSEQSSFSRYFRREVGISPTEFRAMS